MRLAQRKGDIVVARAISTFTSLGFDVSIPLTESAAYDLIVDTQKSLKRVQVRFSTSGEVDLRRVHSNSKGYVVRKILVKSYDWLYVLKGNGTEHLIKECLINRRSYTPLEKNILKIS